jgi:hypothetical protein
VFVSVLYLERHLAQSVTAILSNRDFFQVYKQTRAFERRRTVSQYGSFSPIFEGDMPPEKRTPKYDAASGTIAGVLLIASCLVLTASRLSCLSWMLVKPLRVACWSSCTCCTLLATPANDN